MEPTKWTRDRYFSLRKWSDSTEDTILTPEVVEMMRNDLILVRNRTQEERLEAEKRMDADVAAYRKGLLSFLNEDGNQDLKDNEQARRSSLFGLVLE